MEAPAQDRNYIQRAFGRRVTIARIPWNAFIGEFLLTFVCFQYGSKLYAVPFGISLWLVTYSLLKLDPHPVRAMRLWHSHGRHRFDSGSRFYFQSTQEHESWSRCVNTAKRFCGRATSQS